MITTKYQKHQIHSEPLILCGYFRHSCFFPKLLQKDGEILSSFCSGNKQISGGAASMAPFGRKRMCRKRTLYLHSLKSNRKVQPVQPLKSYHQKRKGPVFFQPSSFRSIIDDHRCCLGRTSCLAPCLQPSVRTPYRWPVINMLYSVCVCVLLSHQ